MTVRQEQGRQAEHKFTSAECGRNAHDFYQAVNDHLTSDPSFAFGRFQYVKYNGRPSNFGRLHTSSNPHRYFKTYGTTGNTHPSVVETISFGQFDIKVNQVSIRVFGSTIPNFQEAFNIEWSTKSNPDSNEDEYIGGKLLTKIDGIGTGTIEATKKYFLTQIRMKAIYYGLLPTEEGRVPVGENPPQ